VFYGDNVACPSDEQDLLMVLVVCKFILVIIAFRMDVPARSMDYDSPEERTVRIEEYVEICMSCTLEELDGGTCPTGC